MIEHALYFAIGFLAASLAAIAAAPLVSRRAVRLAVARARLRAPITEKQAVADMDALRAEHAVQQARTERRLARAEEASMGLRAAAGRLTAEILRVKNDLADRDGQLYDLQGEAEALVRRGRDLEATLAATQLALHDAFVERDQALAAQDAASFNAGELEAEASRARARIAVLAAQAEYLEGRVEEVREATQTARDRAASAAAALEAERARSAALDGRVAAFGAANRSLTERLARQETARGELAGRVRELEERLRLSEGERENTLMENGRQLAALADQASALSAATARAAALEARLAALVAGSHAHESAPSPRAEIVGTAEAAAIEDALRAARAERAELQRENESLRDRLLRLGEASRAADGELRNAIAGLGREVVRLFSAQRAAGESEPAAVDERKPANGREIPSPPASVDDFGESPRRRAGRARVSQP